MFLSLDTYRSLASLRGGARDTRPSPAAHDDSDSASDDDDSNARARRRAASFSVRNHHQALDHRTLRHAASTDLSIARRSSHTSLPPTIGSSARNTSLGDLEGDFVTDNNNDNDNDNDNDDDPHQPLVRAPLHVTSLSRRRPAPRSMLIDTSPAADATPRSPGRSPLGSPHESSPLGSPRLTHSDPRGRLSAARRLPDPPSPRSPLSRSTFSLAELQHEQQLHTQHHVSTTAAGSHGSLLIAADTLSSNSPPRTLPPVDDISEMLLSDHITTDTIDSLDSNHRNNVSNSLPTAAFPLSAATNLHILFQARKDNYHQ